MKHAKKQTLLATYQRLASHSKNFNSTLWSACLTRTIDSSAVPTRPPQQTHHESLSAGLQNSNLNRGNTTKDLSWARLEAKEVRLGRSGLLDTRQSSLCQPMAAPNDVSSIFDVSKTNLLCSSFLHTPRQFVRSFFDVCLAISPMQTRALTWSAQITSLMASAICVFAASNNSVKPSLSSDLALANP